MSAGVIYKGIWGGGPSMTCSQREYLGPDIAYGNLGFGSIRIHDGYVATVSTWPDTFRWTNAWDQVILYPGYYEDMSFYGLKNGARSVKFEAASGVRASECVTVYDAKNAWHHEGGVYGAHWNLPVGLHNANDEKFRYDVLSALWVPPGMQAEVIDQNKGEKSIKFYGEDTGRVVHLNDYGWNDRADFVRVSKDTFVYVRTEYGPLQPPQQHGVLAQVVQSLDNRRGSRDLTGTIEFNEEVAESFERSWENATSLGVGVEVGTGEGSPVSAKVSVSLTTTMTVGETTSESHSYGINQSAPGYRCSGSGGAVSVDYRPDDPGSDRIRCNAIHHFGPGGARTVQGQVHLRPGRHCGGPIMTAQETGTRMSAVTAYCEVADLRRRIAHELSNSPPDLSIIQDLQQKLDRLVEVQPTTPAIDGRKVG